MTKREPNDYQKNSRSMRSDSKGGKPTRVRVRKKGGQHKMRDEGMGMKEKFE